MSPTTTSPARAAQSQQGNPPANVVRNPALVNPDMIAALEREIATLKGRVETLEVKLKYAEDDKARILQDRNEGMTANRSMANGIWEKDAEISKLRAEKQDVIDMVRDEHRELVQKLRGAAIDMLNMTNQ